jgi:FKBP-type peptidyl-prolyl cis-trans isomerase FkpA/FKBP-type peptidyl-prolyl cis-trans isomerase FklB
MPALRRLAVCCHLAVLFLGCARGASSQATVSMETEDQKTLYAIGLAIAQNLGQFSLSESDLALVQAGLADGVLRREPKVSLQDYGQKMQAFATQRLQARAEAEKQAAAGFLAAEAAKPGATRTESGLVYSELKAGDGAAPAATDTVSVHYHGTLRDGTVFDSSVERGQPATFRLNQVVKCWTEGLQRMKVGGKSRLVCPADIAYGDRSPTPKIPPGSTLVFEVELLSIGAPQPPPAPSPG